MPSLLSRFFLPGLAALLVTAWTAAISGQTVRFNEIMASNVLTLADENGDYEDWIELHNAGSTPVNLEGWALSDDPAQPFKWIFPERSLEPDGYLLVWASGKDRASSGSLHTNFRITAAGDSLTLHNPEGVLIDALEPVAIPADISYGRSIEDPGTWIFFALPTPGFANAGPAGQLLPETVAFSETSRSFTGSISLALDGAGPGQVIRYTQDGSVPTASSSLYEFPLTISTTGIVRARVFNEAGAAGPVASHHFLRLTSQVAERRSNLPMVVLNCRTIHPASLTKEPERRDGFFYLFDRDEQGISSLARQPDLSVRHGLRVRGSTSQWHPKRPYSVEFWNERDLDAAFGVLGMAADSDWVFYAPYRWDRAFIRNSLAYDLSREIGTWASASRFVEVYVNRDGNSLTAADYMGVYAIVERIKQGSHRLGHDNVNRRDLPPEGPIDAAATGAWTGNYIFKIDRSDDDEYRWRTNRNIPGTMPTIFMVLSRPKMIDLDGGPFFTRTAAEASRQLQYIKSNIQAFEDALFADQAAGFATRSHLGFMDRHAWIDHLLVNAFAKNVDALRLSAFYHKPRDGRIAAGPVWDFDRSMDSYDVRDFAWDTWYGTGDATPYFDIDWWGVLSQDPDFAQAFYDRWAQVRKTVFSDSALTARVRAMGDEIDDAAHGLGSAAARDAARWPEYPPRGGSYQNEIEHLLQWVRNRAAWMDRRRIDGDLLPPPPELASGADPAVIALEAAAVGSIYYSLTGEDPRAEGGDPAGNPYVNPLALNGPTRLVARLRSPDGHWSTPAIRELTLPAPDAAGALLHYWSFNAESLAPFFTVGGAALAVQPGTETEVVFSTGADFAGANARLEEPAGAHLRINYPLGATVSLHLPTVGYDQIVLRYESRRSGQGSGLQKLSYSTDGETYFDWPHPVMVLNEEPHLYAFDFSNVAGVHDNPAFAVRITFLEGEGGAAGNNRFDNITLEGRALEGTNQPPVILQSPGLVELIAGDTPYELDLAAIFHDPDGDPLAISAISGQPGLLAATVADGSLTLEAFAAGEAAVVLQADDGSNPPIGLTFRVLVYPAPFAVAEGPFLFDSWPATAPAGTFPPHMLFLQSADDDPDLEHPLLFAYRIPAEDAASATDVDYPYAASSRTRITGHGSSGISFINTGRKRDLGAALLALDTRRAVDIDVTWTGGTILPNTRVYGIRLQSRIGTAGSWSDVLVGGEPVEYLRREEGDEEMIGPIRLPAVLEGHPHLQLRWKYHHVSGSSGARAQLRLDDILVSATERDSYQAWLARVFPNSADREDPLIAGPASDPWNEGIPNLLRYALEIDPGSSGRALLPRAEMDGGRLSLLFLRSAAKEDIAYLVEASSDLLLWADVLYDSRVDPRENTDGKWMRVVDLLPGAEAGGRRFLRLRIVGPEEG